MEEKKEMGLIEKRAKLIEYQNQISWIASEYAKKHRDDAGNYSWEKHLSVMLYENLRSIICQIKDLGLEKYLSDAYKENCKELLLRLGCDVNDSKQLNPMETF